MALDSQTKRRSVLATGLAFLVIAPLTDGTTSAVDREHITGLYAGINPTTHVATADLHIFSTSLVEPNHVADSGDNVLFAPACTIIFIVSCPITSIHWLKDKSGIL